MDVLISWSKAKSRKAATAIYEWLPTVLPGIKPWMSDKDIDKGKAWFGELQALLADAKLCIICITEENVRSPWLYYEAGAIATKQGVWVCPYLLGVNANILADGPLGKFQCTESTQADTLALIRSLNKALTTPHNEGLIAGNFAGKWPALESQIRAIEAERPRELLEFTKTEADELAGFNLSSEARRMLIEATKGDGKVTRTRSRAGTYFSANEQDLCDTGNPRSEALWEQALEELVHNRLLDAVGNAGTLFRLTALGYKVADKLQESQPKPRNLDDNDILSILESWLATKDRHRLDETTFVLDDVDRELRLPNGAAARLLETAGKKWGYVAARKGRNTLAFGKGSSFSPSVVNPKFR